MHFDYVKISGQHFGAAPAATACDGWPAYGGVWGERVEEAAGEGGSENAREKAGGRGTEGQERADDLLAGASASGREGGRAGGRERFVDKAADTPATPATAPDTTYATALRQHGGQQEQRGSGGGGGGGRGDRPYLRGCGEGGDTPMEVRELRGRLACLEEQVLLHRLQVRMCLCACMSLCMYIMYACV